MDVRGTESGHEGGYILHVFVKSYTFSSRANQFVHRKWLPDTSSWTSLYLREREWVSRKQEQLSYESSSFMSVMRGRSFNPKVTKECRDVGFGSLDLTLVCRLSVRFETSSSQSFLCKRSMTKKNKREGENEQEPQEDKMNMKAECIKRIMCKVVFEDYIERDHTKRNERCCQFNDLFLSRKQRLYAYFYGDQIQAEFVEKE